MAEIIHLLGSSSLMALPVAADFDSELEPSLERYMSTDTMSAVDRAKVFHLAWDLTCSAFGSRQTHYERFFAGDPVYNAIVGSRNADLEPAKEMVREFLAR
jgi:4-hydroxyphenylacetate 3-monooxygenase